MKRGNIASQGAARSARGLGSGEARRLLEKYGYNEVRPKKKNPYAKFLRKFYGPVQLLLWLVAILSFATGRMDDFYIIIVLLVSNAAIGFVEERKADRSVEALSSMLASTTRVLRDGTWEVLQARLLVPGDVIRVRPGDRIPADAKVVECELLESDESVITGESMPVVQTPGDMFYQGATIKRGEATCIVTGTGPSTRYGTTEKLVAIASPASHLEEAIMRLVKYLVAGDGVIVAAMFLYGVYVFHMPPLTLIPFLLVIFVASVPVALSAAFTVSMALGTEKLAKKSVLVTKLEAVEDIATMTILCTDKTGTLTQNAITVKEVIAYGCTEQEVLRYAAEASREEDEDPIDMALLEYSSAIHVKAGRRLSFSPFSPSTKRTEALIADNGTKYTVSKGATWVITKLASSAPSAKKRVDADVEALANRGLRAIAVAVRKGSARWSLVGLIALYDPPRKEVGRLINELNDLGISVKMITGDSLTVAKEIAKEIGLGKNIVELRHASENVDRIVKSDGFAAVYPQDKYTIVKALQKKGYIVGMTGDGVNDAPALKEAEVGIAVANATDVAKSSAALVLTRDGLEVIVDAVKESRRIFERMSTYTLVKVTKVFQIVGFVAIAFVLLKAMVITPFLLILLLFTNDIVNITLSTDNVTYSVKPDSWNIRSMIYSAGTLGILLAVETLVFIPIGIGLLGLTLVQFQTMVFLMFNITDQFIIFNLRDKRHFWSSRPSIPLMASSGAGILVGMFLARTGILMAGISTTAIAIVLGISLLFLLVNDAVKSVVFRKIGAVAR